MANSKTHKSDNPWTITKIKMRGKKKEDTWGFVVGWTEDEATVEKGRVGVEKNVKQSKPDLPRIAERKREGEA
jgi:hypothetical protein